MIKEIKEKIKEDPYFFSRSSKERIISWILALFKEEKQKWAEKMEKEFWKYADYDYRIPPDKLIEALKQNLNQTRIKEIKREIK